MICLHTNFFELAARKRRDTISGARNRFTDTRLASMPNAPETRSHAHTSLSQVQRGAQHRLTPQLEQQPITMAALRPTTAHSAMRAVGNRTALPAAIAAAVTWQSGLAVLTLDASKGGGSRSDLYLGGRR